MKQIEFIVNAGDEGNRIDKFISVKYNDITRSGLEKLFKSGKILINGRSRAKNYKLNTGDEIILLLEEPVGIESVKPQNLPLEILFEDECLLVVNKEKGMTVHPASAEESDTLVNALLYHCGGKLSTVGGELRPGIVHRIDKYTSGLLVVAKTDEAHKGLAKQVEAHTMQRRYEGIVHGRIKDDKGSISAPIGRHPVQRTKNCVRENARHAVTHYRVIQRFSGFSHVEFELETGRMHQIRVHMAHINHPVAGDRVYGPPKPVRGLNGQCLHAGMLGFIHPATNKKLEFFAELPPCFKDFLNKLILEDSR